MKKFTGNYCNTRGNFIVCNLPLDNSNTQDKYFDTICVLKNILTRGDIIVPSKYLKNKYDYQLSRDLTSNVFLNNKCHNWDNVIKGGSSNPALDFYNNFEEIFPNFKFVKELILPEAYIEDIIGESIPDIREERVDFYISQAKLIIEIDGYQHKNAKYYDNKRDNILQKFGYQVVRITTNEIKYKDSSYWKKIKTIEDIFINSNELKIYQHNSNLPKTKENLTYIYRLEIIILELLLANKISLDDKKWCFKISDNINKELLFDAYFDLKEWLGHLFLIRNMNVELPIIDDNDIEENSIYIDINIYERYNDLLSLNPQIIYSRTDYFDDKNYFKLASGKSINYNIKNESTNSLKWLLFNIFGFEDFKAGQLPIIRNLLNLKTTIGVLPTGSGKSLCYQFAALLQPATAIIVCPLVSLIKDQCDSMKRIEITNTRTIDSTLKIEEKNKVLKDIGEGKSLFTWISPERFQTNSFRSEIQKLASKYNITYAIIDEVHCLSEWGHDFRISYLQLVKVIRSFIPNSVLVGLTATLSLIVLNDIKREFGLLEENFDSVISKSNFARNELYFEIHNDVEGNKREILNKYMDKILANKALFKNNSGYLIFTPFKGGSRGCIRLCDYLKNRYPDYSDKIDYFASAGTPSEQVHNKMVQEKFINNELLIVVATKAFGMGIDKPNIRYTTHFGMASSIDSLYQEVGRAGREGQYSQCIIIHAIDIADIKSMVKNPYFNIEEFGLAYGDGDVGDQITLLIGDIKKPQNEVQMLTIVFRYLKNLYNKYGSLVSVAYQNILFLINDFFNNKQPYNVKLVCENILYKLYIVGLIEDWTIDFAKEVFEIKINDVTDKEMVNNINKYIRKTESTFDIFNIDRSKYQKYYDIFNSSLLSLEEKCLKIICEWYYEKITYRRILETCNLDDVLNIYNTNEELKKYLNEYYTLDDDNIKLSHFLQYPKDFLEVFKLFEEENTFITKEKCEKMAIILDRFLVDSKYNDALNLLDTLLSLILDRNYNLSIISRILEEVNNGELSEKFINIGKLMPKDNLKKYFDVLKVKYNSFKYLNMMYDISKNEDIYLEILQNFNERIKDIERKFL